MVDHDLTVIGRLLECGSWTSLTKSLRSAPAKQDVKAFSGRWTCLSLVEWECALGLGGLLFVDSCVMMRFL